MGRDSISWLYLLPLFFFSFALAAQNYPLSECVVLSLTPGATYSVNVAEEPSRIVIHFPGMTVMELAQSIESKLGDDRRAALVKTLLCKASPEISGAQLVAGFSVPDVSVRLLRGDQSSQLMIYVQASAKNAAYRDNQDKAVFYSSASFYTV